MDTRLPRFSAAIRRRLGVPCLIDSEPDHRATIFVAGTARSGTTWVAELINHRNEYRYLFEPFHPGRIPLVRPFGPRRYLRPTEAAPDLRAIAEQIVTGRIRHRWTERFNRRLVSSRRLIKCIRSNLFLKWLHTHFPGMPIVLVLRDPVAVAHSYARQGWRGSVEPLLAQPTLLDDFLGAHREAIGQAGDPFARALLIWCIETLVPLRQFRRGELHIVFYEKLIREPEAELHALFTFLGKKYDASVLGAIARPSLTARRDSSVVTGAYPAGHRPTKLEPDRVRGARALMDRFGLGGIYSEAGIPNAAAALALMEA